MHFPAVFFLSVLGAFAPPEGRPQTDPAPAPAITDDAQDYRLLPKPWWLRTCTKEWQWVTLDPRIYHPPRIDPLSRPAVMAHEKVHVAQQRRTGKYRWLIRYLTSKKFRLDQELEPIMAEMLSTPPDARRRLAARYARNLAGPPYARAARTAELALDAIEAKAAEMGVEM
jgi:hypothetical protein